VNFLKLTNAGVFSLLALMAELIRAKNFRERRMDTDLINSQIQADFKIH
jgi:hypothetical protein